MRVALAFIFFSVFSLFVRAQEEPTIIWSDDFSSEVNWEVENESDFGWFISTNSELNSWSEAINVDLGSSSGAPFAELHINSPFNEDGEFVAPEEASFKMTTTNPIDISGDWAGFVLAYEVFGASFNDSLKTQISTDGVSFTDVAFIAGGPILPTPNTPTTTNTTLKRINISDEVGAGEQIWIRFEWKGSTAYGWAIDDVRIVEEQANDLRVLSAHRADYQNGYNPYKVPYTQQTERVFAAEIENLGGETQVDVPVVFYVDDPAFSNTEYITIHPGETVYVLSESGWLPNSVSYIGAHFVSVQIPMDATPEDNFATAAFEVSEFLYSNGPQDIETHIEQVFPAEYVGQAYAIGDRFEVYMDQTMYGVFINFGPSTDDGEEVVVRVIMNGDSLNQNGFDNGSIVGEVEYTIPLESTYPECPALVYFPGGVDLLAGEIYQIEVLKSFEGVMSIMSSYDGDIDQSTQNLGDFGNADPSFNWYGGWNWTPEIAISFDPTEPNINFPILCGMSVENEEQAILHLYQNTPNPAINQTQINFELAKADLVSLEIRDMTGMLVKSEKLGKRGAGTQSYLLDIRKLEAGLYTYSMLVDGQRFAKIMIVE